MGNSRFEQKLNKKLAEKQGKFKIGTITIESGRVFIEGRETVDPTHIGYAVLDFAESFTHTVEETQKH